VRVRRSRVGVTTRLGFLAAVAAVFAGVVAFAATTRSLTAVLVALPLVLLVVLFGVLDRGRLISPAYSRLDKRNLEKLRRVTADRERALAGGAD